MNWKRRFCETGHPSLEEAIFNNRTATNFFAFFLAAPDTFKCGLSDVWGYGCKIKCNQNFFIILLFSSQYIKKNQNIL